MSEYSAEYRPGGLNIELCIQVLNIVLNIDLETWPNIELYIRILNIVLNIDLEGQI